VRHALGRLGVVLEEFGFHVTASGNTGTYQEFWFEHPSRSKQTVPLYLHLLSWTLEMQDNIRQYDAQFQQAIVVYNEIQLLKEERNVKKPSNDGTQHKLKLPFVSQNLAAIF